MGEKAETQVRVYLSSFDQALAREKGLPEGWSSIFHGWIGDAPEHWTHCEIRGAVYPPKTRGKFKGQPNYRKPEPGTYRVLVVEAGELQRLHREAKALAGGVDG